jgi:hypothetical protein
MPVDGGGARRGKGLLGAVTVAATAAVAVATAA